MFGLLPVFDTLYQEF